MTGNSPNTRHAQLASAVTACCVALGAAAPHSAWAGPQETVLHSFTGPPDGTSPYDEVIADSAGNLYGTTFQGGASDLGTVFKVTPSGTETVLHSFTAGVADGAHPHGGLIADSAGNLYGTTLAGGSSGACYLGCGTVFKLTPSGTETVLYTFTGHADGGYPYPTLIADSAGNLYGTTYYGGVSGYGTVFRLTPSGTETVLHSFTGFDGARPGSVLIADSAGNLYGTTVEGGVSRYHYGTVFKLTADGTESVLYSFAGTPDGANPNTGLIADSAGNLYGTTTEGGVSDWGTVFKLTPSGTETVLYSFKGAPDGARPEGILIADSAGNLYGTTYQGGASGGGTVFKLTPSGTETILYSFTGGADGTVPFAGLIADAAGNLYGTTEAGGASDFGTVFKLTGTGFVTAPAEALAALLAEVTGVGPGRSLADKVALVQTYYSANDIPNTCSTLTSFVNEVTAQRGKKINQSFAAQLISDAQNIQSAIGCGPQ